MKYVNEISKRRTFAIISHPDAGKTTLTEKFLLFGGAIQTAGAVKSNKIKKHATSDFMDIDSSFAKKSSQKVSILLHGLEGNAQRTYMKGQAKVLNQNGWDVAAINFRGCSGEANLSYQSYNAGKTDDLEAAIN